MSDTYWSLQHIGCDDGDNNKKQIWILSPTNLKCIFWTKEK